jgi:hypothetical protein
MDNLTKYTLKNSDILEKVLTNIIDIFSRKSVKIHSVIVLSEIVEKLQSQYPFLTNIDIRDKKDLHEFKDDRTVTIEDTINKISPEKVGMSLHAILDGFAKVIGKNDTYFLLTELQSSLPGDYISQIGSMGVDFELILLEREIDYLETGK